MDSERGSEAERNVANAEIARLQQRVAALGKALVSRRVYGTREDPCFQSCKGHGYPEHTADCQEIRAALRTRRLVKWCSVDLHYWFWGGTTTSDAVDVAPAGLRCHCGALTYGESQAEVQRRLRSGGTGWRGGR